MVSQAAGSGAVSSGGRAEESSTVVVGAAPDLGEVLNGEAEHPFDRESFTEYARRNLFVESLEFLVEVCLDCSGYWGRIVGSVCGQLRVLRNEKISSRWHSNIICR